VNMRAAILLLLVSIAPGFAQNCDCSYAPACEAINDIPALFLATFSTPDRPATVRSTLRLTNPSKVWQRGHGRWMCTPCPAGPPTSEENATCARGPWQGWRAD